jgi:hypothetical protein
MADLDFGIGGHLAEIVVHSHNNCAIRKWIISWKFDDGLKSFLTGISKTLY